MAHQRSPLELESDQRFQKWEWRVQRLGWLAWAVVLGAASLGLTGPGWLSDVQVTSADRRTIVLYDRFLHYHHPSQLDVIYIPQSDSSEEVEISLERSLVDCMQLLRIEPEPIRSELHEHEIHYTFNRTSEATRIKVVFHAEYERYGAVEGKITINGSEAVALSQFVYP